MQGNTGKAVEFLSSFTTFCFHALSPKTSVFIHYYTFRLSSHFDSFSMLSAVDFLTS